MSDSSTSSNGTVPEGSNTAVPGGELVVADKKKRQPVQITRFGSNNDRPPKTGLRSILFEHGINLGASDAEIIRTDRRGCERCREELGRVPDVLCAGVMSHKGGDGKSTLSTLLQQEAHYINPVAERSIILDINTSMTTLDVLNGLNKKDFLTGKFWTMETLWAFLVNHPDLKNLKFSEINAKLAYRSNPQLPVIPMRLIPTKRGSDKSKTKFTAEQYLLVLRVLKRFFTLIIHDFGTDDDTELAQTAFSQLHMLAVLTHSGYATTQMVGHTLEMLFLDHQELFLNTTVIFNLSSAPSPQAVRAIALEKAGKKPKLERLLGGVGARINSVGKSEEEEESAAEERKKIIHTPGQALEVINEIIKLRDAISPLEKEEIVLVGHDEHLDPEGKIHLGKVRPEVQGQLWTAYRTMLEKRVEFEKNFLEQLPEGVDIERDQMKVRFVEKEDEVDGEQVRWVDVEYIIEQLPAPNPATKQATPAS